MKVSFQSDIDMPSYLVKEIEEKTSKAKRNLARTKRRDRRLGYFMRSDYEREPNGWQDRYNFMKDGMATPAPMFGDPGDT